MLRLACALARLLNKDGNSPSTSTPSSPTPRKTSLKSKPTWRSASVHSDNRAQGFKCPFTANNALAAATKKEIAAYNSSEEIRAPASRTISTERINEGEEFNLTSIRNMHRRSLAVSVEHHAFKSSPEKIVEVDDDEDRGKSDDIPTSPQSDNVNMNTEKRPVTRKTSCTVALDVYKRRPSGISRPRLNSLSLINAEKLNSMRERFGTPEKVMHFFGRCFVKFFTNYG